MDEAKSARLREAVREYYVQRPIFEKLCRVLESALRTMVADMPSPPLVFVRPKGLASFANKVCDQFDDYPRPLEQMSDLAGGRVVALTQGDVDEICRRVETHPGFEIDWRHSGDTVERLRPQEFGYRGRHYVMRLAGAELGIHPDDLAIQSKRIELQVKTHLQHVWAEIEHDRSYKTALTVPPRLLRELGRIAGLLERADDSFQELVSSLDRFRDDVPGPASALNEQIEICQIILEAQLENQSPDECDRLLHQQREVVLRLARLQRVAGDPRRAYESLKCLARAPQADVALELGLAALAAGDRTAARQHLVVPDDSPGQPPRTDIEVPRLLALAELESERDVDAALRHLRKAARLAPADPEVVVKLVECALIQRRDPSLFDLLQGAVTAALRDCEQRLAVGVRQARMRFLQARLLLYRKVSAPWDAMHAYARAVCGVNDCAPIEDERNAITRIINALHVDPADLRKSDELRGLAWVQMMLDVLGVAKARQPSAQLARGASPNQRRFAAPADLSLDAYTSSPPPGFSGRVLIIAGGCSRFPENRSREYTHLLEETLRGFHGSVIGGGTTAGVSGLVAEVRERVAPNAPLVGYVSAKRPPTDRIHPGYSPCIEVDDEDYTPLGPLQTWADLLQARIPATEVRLLGINGGRLARFEYELALACGAIVGVVADSLRAADELLHDPFWKNRRGLAPVPNDPAVVRALVHGECVGAIDDRIAEAGWIDEAAKLAHKKYRAKAIARGWVPDELQRWAQLPEEYRNSNRHYAAYAETAVRAIGLDVIPRDDDHPGRVGTFTEGETEQLARLEHGRYVAERLASGWRLGPKSREMRTHPALVAWDDLSPGDQQKDRDNVALYTVILEAAGLTVVRPAATRER